MMLKVCGVQSADEALKLAHMGVEYVGLNFVPSSARVVDIKHAQEIADAVRGTDTQVVALFQDQPPGFVMDVVQKIRPGIVQLHGHEDAAYVKNIGLPVIKVVPVRPLDVTDNIVARMTEGAAIYLFDRADRGTGSPINLATVLPLLDAHTCFVAGGLDAQNLTNVLGSARPYGIDVAGGARTNGQIDMDKVAQLQAAIRRLT